MTEKKPHDIDSRTASAISKLYQQIEINGPDEKIDATILAAARQKTQKHSYRSAWTIPAAIAAILLISLSIFWWQNLPSPIPTNGSRVSSAPTASDTLTQQLDKKLNDDPAANQWLERILNLQMEGKHKEAAKEFRKFRQTYPVYHLDHKRFGKLEQYDK